MRKVIHRLFFVLLALPRSTQSFASPRRNLSFRSINPNNRETATAITTTTSLSAISPAVKWALAHWGGGLLPVPFVTKATNGWYKRISLPPWTPPDRLFGPVWTALYTSLGVAAYRVASSSSSLVVMPLWFAHMALNYVWAPVFFGMQRLRLGLIINCLLVASLTVLIPLFHQQDVVAGLLLLPYTMWVSFATVLNWAICKRNPTTGGYNEAMIQAKILNMQKGIV